VNVWLIQVGEPLPIDEPTPRLMRTGQLAQKMTECGHQTTWWTSAFSHQMKKMRSVGDHIVNHRSGSYRLKVVPALGYQRHLSLRRWADEKFVARKILRGASREDRPDVIIASLPTLAGVHVAARLARRFECRLIIDVRDLWPDILVEKVPPGLAPMARLVVKVMRMRLSVAMKVASAIHAPSEDFVKWGLALTSREQTKYDRDFPLAYADLSIEQPAFPQAEPLISGSDTQRKVAVFVGTLVPQFNFEVLLDLARLMTDVDFVICGAGPLYDTLLAESPTNMKLRGWLGAAELKQVLNAADVGLAPYVSTKDFEGNIPNKIVEYLACGLPIVTSIQNGPVVEILESERVGTVASPADVKSWSDAVQSWLVLSDSELESVRLRCRELFLEQFDAESVSLNIVHTVEELVSEINHSA